MTFFLDFGGHQVFLTVFNLFISYCNFNKLNNLIRYVKYNEFSVTFLCVVNFEWNTLVVCKNQDYNKYVKSEPLGEEIISKIYYRKTNYLLQALHFLAIKRKRNSF